MRKLRLQISESPHHTAARFERDFQRGYRFITQQRQQSFSFAFPVQDGSTPGLARKKITHEIGQNLALLSVGELNERIGLLKEEIERLQAAANSKQASRSAADKFFKS